jgi:hypothetical protein
MKQFKDFLVVEDTISEDGGILLPEGFVYDEEPLLEKISAPHQHNVPAVLVLRRTSFRLFPNGQTIALYHADKINKYITIPYDNDTIPMNGVVHNK